MSSAVVVTFHNRHIAAAALNNDRENVSRVRTGPQSRAGLSVTAPVLSPQPHRRITEPNLLSG